MNQQKRKILDIVANVGMAIFDILAILLVSFKSPWGFVAGLCSQPFFFMCSILNRQWGLFILNIIYTISWAIGAYHWFAG
ncbi:MAG: hypothetical protein WC582_04745 [Patescibacteria group bacterium]|jgi:hypothetical protein